jgi:peptide-methionine (S)-S-oxide reductase
MSEKATFAAGCFWGVEHAFRQIDGVTSTTVGYTGGTVDNPDYETVCRGRTGHAEAVEVEYDPEQVAYEQLLAVFWNEHDPTQRNRQGPDFGTQYRSAVFVHTPEQRRIAERSLNAMQTHLGKPIATEITDAPTFWPAEDYHQRYFEKTGQYTCRMRPAPEPVEARSEPVEQKTGILASLFGRS